MTPEDVLLLSVTRNGPHPLVAEVLHNACTKYGFRWAHQWGCSDLVFTRSQVFLDALKVKPKAIVSIDSDILFEVDQLMAIVNKLSVEDKIGQVGGFYMRRGGNDPSFRLDGPVECNLGVGGDIIPVSGLGLGFTAILTEALVDAQKLAPVVVVDEKIPLVCMPLAINNIYYSEDYALTWRIRAAGWKTLADLSTCVKHIGDHPFDYHDSLVVHHREVTSKILAEGYRVRFNGPVDPECVKRLQNDLDLKDKLV